MNRAHRPHAPRDCGGARPPLVAALIAAGAFSGPLHAQQLLAPTATVASFSQRDLTAALAQWEFSIPTAIEVKEVTCGHASDAENPQPPNCRFDRLAVLRFDLPRVWSNAVRFDALVTFFIAGGALLFTPWLLVITALLGGIRGMLGHHRCPVHGLWSGLLQQRGRAGRQEDVGAKMFAAKILFIASVAGLVLHGTGSGLWVVPAGALLVFSFLEWAFSFCAGCWAYGLWYRFFPPQGGA